MKNESNIFCGLNDEALAYAELKNDLLFHKIPKDKINYYINESLNLGRNKAKEYKNSNIMEICKANGLKIDIVKESGKFYSVRFRAEISFSKKENIIKIYESSLIDLMNSCNKTTFLEDKLTYEDVINIHLAHEFYHFIEYKEKQYTNELLDPINILEIWKLRKKSSVLKCSEIAAHKFCKDLLGLKYMPNIYDYLYLVEIGEMSLEEFRNMRLVEKG